MSFAAMRLVVFLGIVRHVPTTMQLEMNADEKRFFTEPASNILLSFLAGRRTRDSALKALISGNDSNWWRPWRSRDTQKHKI